MKDKTYPCKKCGTHVRIRSKGLCPYCRSKSKGTLVSRYYITQQTKKTKEKRKKRGELLKVFFSNHLQTVSLSPFCANCGINLRANLANIAHILPKRSTANPEVLDEPLNAIYLCAVVNGEPGCHDRYDRIQSTPKVYLMPCWEKCVERYLTFREKIVHYNKYVKMFEDWIEESSIKKNESSIEEHSDKQSEENKNDGTSNGDNI